MQDPATLQIPALKNPVKLALIGTGRRAWKIYRPLFSALKPWIQIVAVCDPVEDNRERMAKELAVPDFADIRALAKSKTMEAALIVTPPDSHHSLAVFLASQRIHCHVETPLCIMVRQAQEMLASAKENGVILRVAENFFRFPIDRFAQRVRDSGVIGPIKRIVSYADHTGFHNNSRWIAFARAHPLWVQALEHEMPVASFRSTPERFHDHETYEARFLQFPEGLLVADSLANVKGFLGRQARPGYTEWQGERGALVNRGSAVVCGGGYRIFDGEEERTAEKEKTWSPAQTELRRCVTPAAEGTGAALRSGWADEVSIVRREFDARNRWLGIACRTSAGLLEHRNPFLPEVLSEHPDPEYGCAVMDHLIDFALAVRGTRASEFGAEDALMSLMIEAGVRASVLRQGARVALPLQGEIEMDEAECAVQRKKHGVDPLDVEAMLSISFPRP